MKGSSVFTGTQSVRYSSGTDGPHRDITYPFTMTGYVYIPSYANQNNKYAFSMTDGTGGGTETAIGCYFNGSTPGIFAGDGTSTDKQLGTALSYDTWYYITVVVNSATDRKLYVDGVLDKTFTTSIDVVANKTNMNESSVGTFVLTSGSNLFYYGLVVYPQFYNDALTTGEMASQMTNPSNILDNCIWAPDLQVESATIGDYTDLSGSGYTPNAGTAPLYHLRNPVINYGAGCVDFDGTTNESFVTMGSFSGLDGATECSLVTWINWNTIASNKSIGGQYVGFPNATWYHSSESDGWGITLIQNGSNYRIAHTTAILSSLFTAGTWAHTVITWKRNNDDITDFKCYIDGTDTAMSMTGSVGTLTALATATQDFELGCLNKDSFNIDAKLAFFALYDRQLSQKEAQALMVNPNSVLTNRVSYIPCDEFTFQDLETRDTADQANYLRFSLRDESPPFQ